MHWWPRRNDSGESATTTEVMASRVRRYAAVDHGLRDRQSGRARRRVTRVTRRATVDGGSGVAVEVNDDDGAVTPISLGRVRSALDRIDVRYLSDPEGSLLAMWERHAVMIALEGPADEILMMRVRPHATVPRDWADRAYRAVNEWNHARRFCKAYVGDVSERGQLPIYAEVQVPLVSGLHEALLVELLDCGVTVAHGFVEWLHGEGCLL